MMRESLIISPTSLEIDSPSRGRKLIFRTIIFIIVKSLEIDSPSRGRKPDRTAYNFYVTSLEIDSPSRGRKPLLEHIADVAPCNTAV